ncbi:hypothetical protein TNIN_271571 [Trichonephila inaurata madagascariensis]|uniref:Uncharacterized protein n=1 Tax=Trichonephila inaurata madagascariensis TaxID=2747483 RepID=A0A8X6XB50_9ARAC|nr:hypothetical protein TNIN_271571 [Trichonephila inaurata madagascariensis]
MDEISYKQIVHSARIDDESRKQNVNSKLVETLDKKANEISSETDLYEQTPAKVLQETEAETLLGELLISTLESLAFDVTKSVEMAVKDMYVTKVVGIDSDHGSYTSKNTGTPTERSPSTCPKKTGTATEHCPSTSPEETGTAFEHCPSTNPEETGTATEHSPEKTGTLTEKTNPEDDEECCLCAFFESMDHIYSMQLELLDIRREIKKLAEMLLEERNKLNSCDCEEIKSADSLYENILNQNKEIALEFEEGEYILDHWDATGALRLSSQIMQCKYFLVDNDKFLEAFKYAQIIMTQWLLSREGFSADTEMDDKSCKRCAKTELLTSQVTDILKENSSETNLGIRKFTRTLDEKSETLLLQVLDQDVIRLLKRSLVLLPKALCRRVPRRLLLLPRRI